MDWEKLKTFIDKHKTYFFTGLACLMVVFVFEIKKSESNENINDFDDENTELLQSEKDNTDNLLDKTNSEKTKTEEIAAAKPKNVTCDISGAVNHQGVYTLKNGARLNELIAAAGGIKSNAQLKRVNRALILKDQDKIHIPYKGEKIKAEQVVESVSSTSSGSVSAENSDNKADQTTTSNKVNINTADVAQLQQLNGIGEKKAQQIIAYRQKNGQFKSIEELKQVSGIGEKTFVALKEQLEV
ncbi:helix-hairpin-helix domain-containing protein [Lactobacillus kullabergensis]|uniref:helix-hairpin-helix domain-containing protein n=1 Tax=Lactobacillus kullabergensis TaxID=1218493 RepID=UPI0022451396|nr:helix-hairpin-helix domain-containing protein [Lactobacillus kullabergensis]MCX0290592.1 helix-hairpin-helix domain-containing protein [Lactobacillus kullabergensis]